jgi:hypothetical protein
MTDEERIREKYETLACELNERTRRLWAAVEATDLGRGGLALVARATGLARQAIARGQQGLLERGPRPIEGAAPLPIREEGGGRKKETEIDPTLWSDLEGLVEPLTRGDPESPLRWTCKSTRQLATSLRDMGHNASHTMVGDRLREHGYSLQGNEKTIEGGDHPDRNAQFEHIN